MKTLTDALEKIIKVFEYALCSAIENYGQESFQAEEARIVLSQALAESLCLNPDVLDKIFAKELNILNHRALAKVAKAIAESKDIIIVKGE